jgi:hypothetical protein
MSNDNLKIVKLSPLVENILDDYFGNYQILGFETDMPQRAYNYSRILYSLAHIDALLDDVYVIDHMNFIDIDDICKVRFAKNGNAILIEEIYFNNE